MIGIGLLVRLIHLSYVVVSPLNFALGPDENFYLLFAQELSADSASSGLTTFMDPLYGYFIYLVGGEVFAIYVLQILADATIVYALILLGKEFGRFWTGILAAILYAFYGVAILYSATVLKATFVAVLAAWWSLLAIQALDRDRLRHWIALGALTAAGVALRSNIALLAVLSFVLLPAWPRHGTAFESKSEVRNLTAGLRLAGLSVGALPLLLLLSAHYLHFGQRIQLLPNNGGVVLHQLYNPHNPTSEQFVPSFVASSDPVSIWAGYTAEAATRSDTEPTPEQVSQFWRLQAIRYISANPSVVAQAAAAKAGKFFAAQEVPNNRSMLDEQLFSPVLRVLPPLSALFIVLGLPGLFLISRAQNGAILWIPILVFAGTFVVFFAEARFRFHAMPIFVFAAAWMVVGLTTAIRRRQWQASAALASPVIALAVLSWSQSSSTQSPPISWERIATGYLRMGDLQQAEVATDRWQATGPARFRKLQLQSAVALVRKDHATAIKHGEAAVSVNRNSDVAWHNLALGHQGLGNLKAAENAAQEAVLISPVPDNLLLLASLQRNLDKRDEALKSFERVLQSRHPPPNHSQRRIAESAIGQLRSPSP